MAVVGTWALPHLGLQMLHEALSTVVHAVG